MIYRKQLRGLRYNLLEPINNLRRDYFVYTYNKKDKIRILNRIRKQDRVTIFFLVINIGMWKSNKLFKKLLENRKFEPYIVTSFIPGDTPEYKEYVQNNISDYFEKLGFPVIKTYNPTTKKCSKIKELNADVVIYPQPYHKNLKELSKNTLYAYIPYDYPIQDDKVYHGWVYHEICWRIFSINKNYKSLEEKYSKVRGENVKVVGYSNADYYFDNHQVDTSMWKVPEDKIKRIIWAPHHSILSSDTMGQSLFLELAQSFLDLTNKYKKTCQFVFKPHPRLKDKLYQLNGWGKEKTDEYYKKWEKGENTSFVEGDYIDLFLSSDAMIHDCSSFIAEYFYTGHPVMFLTKNNYDYNLHGTDNDLFNAMYHGYNIRDVEDFINKILLADEDVKVSERKRILNDVLEYTEGEQVCEKIYNEFLTLL